MNRILTVLAATVLAVPGAAYSAEVKAMEVTLKSGEEQIKGYLAVPEGKGPFPAVVVVQEWWGLNDWVKENARRLAGEGYVALAPDLYRGQVTDNPMVASRLRQGLPNDRALRDLKGAVDFLANHEAVNKSKIGCIGWCMGGQYALDLAVADNRVKACVICYGRVITDPKKLESLEAAVLGVFGEDDRGIPAAGVRQFEEALKTAGKKVEKINIFKGAGHGFMREKNGERENPEYRADATKDAWRQIEAFFAKTLKEK